MWGQPRGRPGEFDYYVFSLSWSPEYCASPAGQNDSIQCGGSRSYAFVAHGLWPQYERGFPESCASGPGLDRALVDRMLAIMPSPKLVRHEWERHGTCSGLAAAKYFDLLQKAFATVKIPREFQNPSGYITLEPAALKRKFLGANRGIPNGGLTVLCSGRYLREVRLCYTKDLKPRPCGSDVRDACRTDKLVMRPAR